MHLYTNQIRGISNAEDADELVKQLRTDKSLLAMLTKQLAKIISFRLQAKMDLDPLDRLLARGILPLAKMTVSKLRREENPDLFDLVYAYNVLCGRVGNDHAENAKWIIKL